MSKLRAGLIHVDERLEEKKRKRRRNAGIKRPRKYPVPKEYHPCAKCGERVLTKWKFCPDCSKRRGQNDYLAYLRTDAWRARRSAAIKRAGGDCERCGKHATQVHHRTYVRLQNELPEDLEALCAGCHFKEHDRKKD